MRRLFSNLSALTLIRLPGKTTLKFSLRNNHTFTSLTGLGQIINSICGKQVLPDTRYMIDKLCNYEDNTILHSVCTNCSKYIGAFRNIEKLVQCESCTTNVDASNPSNPCYFAVIDPSIAIRDYLQLHQDFYNHIVKERVHEKKFH